MFAKNNEHIDIKNKEKKEKEAMQEKYEMGKKLESEKRIGCIHICRLMKVISKSRISLRYDMGFQKL